jgi:hypothetical protein
MFQSEVTLCWCGFGVAVEGLGNGVGVCLGADGILQFATRLR